MKTGRKKIVFWSILMLTCTEVVISRSSSDPYDLTTAPNDNLQSPQGKPSTLQPAVPQTKPTIELLNVPEGVTILTTRVPHNVFESSSNDKERSAAIRDSDKRMVGLKISPVIDSDSKNDGALSSIEVPEVETSRFLGNVEKLDKTRTSDLIYPYGEILKTSIEEGFASTIPVPLDFANSEELTSIESIFKNTFSYEETSDFNSNIEDVTDIFQETTSIIGSSKETPSMIETEGSGFIEAEENLEETNGRKEKSFETEGSGEDGQFLNVPDESSRIFTSSDESRNQKLYSHSSREDTYVSSKDTNRRKAKTGFVIDSSLDVQFTNNKYSESSKVTNSENLTKEEENNLEKSSLNDSKTINLTESITVLKETTTPSITSLDNDDNHVIDHTEDIFEIPFDLPSEINVEQSSFSFEPTPEAGNNFDLERIKSVEEESGVLEENISTTEISLQVQTISNGDYGNTVFEGDSKHINQISIHNLLKENEESLVDMSKNEEITKAVSNDSATISNLDSLLEETNHLPGETEVTTRAPPLNEPITDSLQENGSFGKEVLIDTKNASEFKDVPQIFENTTPVSTGDMEDLAIENNLSVSEKTTSDGSENDIPSKSTKSGMGIIEETETATEGLPITTTPIDQVVLSTEKVSTNTISAEETLLTTLLLSNKNSIDEVFKTVTQMSVLPEENEDLTQNVEETTKTTSQHEDDLANELINNINKKIVSYENSDKTNVSSEETIKPPEGGEVAVTEVSLFNNGVNVIVNKATHVPEEMFTTTETIVTEITDVEASLYANPESAFPEDIFAKEDTENVADLNPNVTPINEISTQSPSKEEEWLKIFNSTVKNEEEYQEKVLDLVDELLGLNTNYESNDNKFEKIVTTIDPFEEIIVGNGDMKKAQNITSEEYNKVDDSTSVIIQKVVGNGRFDSKNISFIAKENDTISNEINEDNAEEILTSTTENFLVNFIQESNESFEVIKDQRKIENKISLGTTAIDSGETTTIRINEDTSSIKQPDLSVINHIREEHFQEHLLKLWPDLNESQRNVLKTLTKDIDVRNLNEDDLQQLLNEAIIQEGLQKVAFDRKELYTNTFGHAFLRAEEIDDNIEICLAGIVGYQFTVNMSEEIESPKYLDEFNKICIRSFEPILMVQQESSFVEFRFKLVHDIITVQSIYINISGKEEIEDLFIRNLTAFNALIGSHIVVDDLSLDNFQRYDGRLKRLTLNLFNVNLATEMYINGQLVAEYEESAEDGVTTIIVSASVGVFCIFFFVIFVLVYQFCLKNKSRKMIYSLTHR